MHPEEVIAALRFEPLLPLWLIATLGVTALLTVALAAFRRARGTLWRLAAFAVLLLWLAGPRVVQESRDNLPDIGLLVVDQTRLDAGRRTCTACRGRRERRSPSRRRNCRTSSCAPSPCPRAATPARGCSVPSTGRWRTFPRSRLAGTIAITDGQVHDIPDAAPGGAPLNVLIPAKGEETDRRLRVIEAPSYGIVGKTVTLRVAIEDLGVPHPACLGQPDGPPRRRAAAGAERADRCGAAHRAADHPCRSHRGGTVGDTARRARSPRSTIGRSSRSTACATGCGCC